MIDYSKYDKNDFLEDDHFRAWVLNPTRELSAFWNDVILANPDQAENIKKARVLLIVMRERFREDPSDETVKNDIARIRDRILTSENSRKVSLGSFYSLGNWTKIAASILLISALGWFVWRGFTGSEKMITKTNQTESGMTLLLADSSVVVLGKGGSLRYPAVFTKDTREVYLEGEAFFEITKNPDKPFFVYAHETVTKVWGTSFNIRANANDSTVLVSVKTGKVSVYQKGETKNIEGPERQVYLLPNEKGLFDRKRESLTKLADNTSSKTTNESPKELIYEDAPVSGILHALEKNYGIDIVFDEKLLSSCLLNTQFKEEFLSQKLHAVCQAIGASYEIADGHITIRSAGCN